MSNPDRTTALIKAEEAGRVAYSLQEKLLNESIISQMKDELMLTFAKTKLEEDDLRRDLWQKYYIIEWYNEVLTDTIIGGKIASDELEFSKTNIKD